MATERKQRTWQELAQEAYDVQNACNLSGVVHSFSRVVTEVRALLEAEGKLGTAAVNKHPICRLWADKIAHLTGTQCLGSEISDAYDWLRTQGVAL